MVEGLGPRKLPLKGIFPSRAHIEGLGFSCFLAFIVAVLTPKCLAGGVYDVNAFRLSGRSGSQLRAVP